MIGSIFVNITFTKLYRITSYNVCYTKLLRGLPGTPREGTGEDQLQNNTPVMSYISVDNSVKANSTTINAYAEVQLYEGLKFKTVFNISGYDSYREDFRPEWYSYRPGDTDHTSPYRHQSPATLTVYDNTSSLWEWQNLLTYNKDFNKHHVDALAGISSEKSESAYRITSYNVCYTKLLRKIEIENHFNLISEFYA